MIRPEPEPEPEPEPDLSRRSGSGSGSGSGSRNTEAAPPRSRLDVPWYVWTSLASVTCILVGGYWDISWHMSIGRDSFWTPAHIAIQLGGIIAGGGGAYLIFTTTFRRAAPLRDASIRVWGFRGPLGAFLAVWGAATMLISAPFDNWWHEAYGLDVKILSPPHAVLTLGILGVASGGVLQIVATMNRATGASRRALERALLAIGAVVLTLGMTSILEYTFRANLHGAGAYRAMAIVGPLGLFAFARASGRRWAATTIAAGYTAFMVGMVWLFPQFAAEAKLGPVYQPITHFIPLQFPMLIIVPALVGDVVLARLDAAPRIVRAIVVAPLFVGSLVAAQWPFASFLMTEHARNWVFGAHYHPYFMHPGWHETRHVFFDHPTSALIQGFAWAVVTAVITTYAALAIGDAMRKVQR